MKILEIAILFLLLIKIYWTILSTLDMIFSIKNYNTNFVKFFEFSIN